MSKTCVSFNLIDYLESVVNKEQLFADFDVVIEHSEEQSKLFESLIPELHKIQQAIAATLKGTDHELVGALSIELHVPDEQISESYENELVNHSNDRPDLEVFYLENFSMREDHIASLVLAAAGGIVSVDNSDLNNDELTQRVCHLWQSGIDAFLLSLKLSSDNPKLNKLIKQLKIHNRYSLQPSNTENNAVLH